MFCPKCKTEYREGFHQCADCGIPLVDVLPRDQEEHKIVAGELSDSEDLAVVFQSHSNYDFISAAKILEEEGIPYCGFDASAGEARVDNLAPPRNLWTLLTSEEDAGYAARILGERMCGPLGERDADGPAEDEEEVIDDAEPRESSPRAEHSPMIMEGEGRSRKIILCIIVAAVLGAIILFLRK